MTKRKIVTVVFSVFCIGVLAYYLVLHRQQFSQAISDLGWLYFGLALVTVGLQWGGRIIRDQIMFRQMDYNIPFRGLLFAYCRQNLLNYLPAKAGTIYLAATMKQKYGVSLAHFGAAFAAQNILTLAMILISAGVALLVVNFPAEVHAPMLAAVMFALASGMFAVLFVRLPPFLMGSGRIKTVVDQLHLGMDSLSKDRPRLALTTALSLSGAILTAWRLQLLLSSSVTIPFGTALVLAAVLLVSQVVSITPAGLGIREGIIGATSGFLSISATSGVIVSTLDRIVTLTFVAFLFAAQFVVHLKSREPHGTT